MIDRQEESSSTKEDDDVVMKLLASGATQQQQQEAVSRSEAEPTSSLEQATGPSSPAEDYALEADVNGEKDIGSRFRVDEETPVVSNTPTNQESLPGAYAEAPGLSPNDDGKPSTTVTTGDSGDQEEHSERQTTIEISEETPTAPSSDDASNLVSARPVHEGESGQTLPQADPVQPETGATRHRKLCTFGRARLLVIALCLAVAVSVTVVVVYLRRQTDETTPQEDSNVSTAPLILDEESVMSLLPKKSLEIIEQNPNSPQAQALDWLLNDPYLYSDTYRQATWRLIQRFALATLYYATSIDQLGGGWTVQENWLSYDHHECDWDFPHSVFFEFLELTTVLAVETVCQDEVYTDLRLNKNGLSGRIPPEVALLTALKSLDMSFNSLSGTIPQMLFSEMPHLETVAIGHNRLSGFIPQSLFEASSVLQHLLLQSNNLSGNISTSIGRLTQMKMIAAGNNQLSGSLATQLGRLTSLILLSITENQFSGILPSELGLLSAELKYALWANNQFSGQLPSEIGMLSILRHLRLTGNRISGSLPTEIGGLINTSKLYLGENNIGGVIPSELGHLTSTSRLKLGNNNFSGTIPSQLAELRKHHALLYLDLSGNALLAGTMPAELCTEIRSDPDDTSGFEGIIDCTDIFCGCECACPA